MKLNHLALLSSAVFMTGAAQADLPKFTDYLIPKSDIYTEAPASVDLTSYKGAATYSTKLAEGAKKGPNFAGRYTVVEIGCGTQCIQNWIIDAQSGKIYDQFFSVIGTKYRLDSTLMIVNPPDQQLAKAYKEFPDQPLLGTMDTTAQIWKDNKFESVTTMKWVDAIKDLPQ